MKTTCHKPMLHSSLSARPLAELQEVQGGHTHWQSPRGLPASRSTSYELATFQHTASLVHGTSLDKVRFQPYIFAWCKALKQAHHCVHGLCKRWWCCFSVSLQHILHIRNSGSHREISLSCLYVCGSSYLAVSPPNLGNYQAQSAQRPIQPSKVINQQKVLCLRG